MSFMTFPSYTWWKVFYEAGMKESSVPGSAVTLHSARVPTVIMTLFKVNLFSLHSCRISADPRVAGARRDTRIQSNYPLCVIESYKICSVVSD